MAFSIDKLPLIPNPQLINGMSFRESIKHYDIGTLFIVMNYSDQGFCFDLNKGNRKTFDSLRNLMCHNLVKIDIFECDEGYCPGFSVTEAGKQMCDKMMEIAKS